MIQFHLQKNERGQREKESYNISNSTTELDRTGWWVLTPYGDLNREGATGTRPATAAAESPTRPGAGPAPDIAVRPSRAEAGDPTRAVATGAPRKWAGHGFVHDRFDDGRSGQDAEALSQLSQHDRTAHFFESETIRSRRRGREKRAKKKEDDDFCLC